MQKERRSALVRLFVCVFCDFVFVFSSVRLVGGFFAVAFRLISFRFVPVRFALLLFTSFRFDLMLFVLLRFAPLRQREQYVLTDGKDEEHLSRGVYDTYTNTSLRCVCVR